MTNEKIILNESIRLMNEGIIKGTGKFITIEYEDGTKQQVEVPEQIHTFATWKKMGYVVKKGQKAVAKFPIWKYTERPVKEEEKTGDDKVDNIPVSNMFMKVSAFFTAAQVEKINAGMA